MPQMAPIGWLSLFTLFTLIFILFCMMNYFSFIIHPHQTSLKNKTYHNSLNWKW